MVQRRHPDGPRPLDAAALDALALAYVGRYATTRAKLIRYLDRKLRERGVCDGATVDLEAIADRMVASGYVDDAGFAEGRVRTLFARGYGERRVRGALGQAGIDRDTQDRLLPGDDDRARDAAETYARRRRFGPYADPAPDADRLRRQMAAMLRAGHRFEHAIAVLRPGHR